MTGDDRPNPMRVNKGTLNLKLIPLPHPSSLSAGGKHSRNTNPLEIHFTIQTQLSYSTVLAAVKQLNEVDYRQ